MQTSDSPQFEERPDDPFWARLQEVQGRMREMGRTVYETVYDGEAFWYRERVGDDLRLLTDQEARTVGIWHDPRGGQYAVRDPLATAHQLRARNKGHYDPRPASGKHVARRVLVRCAKCGTDVSEIHDYEQRALVLNKPSGRWFWSNLDRWELYRCVACNREATEGIRAALERARATNKTVTIKA